MENFPQYRKLSNGKNYYRIDNTEQLEEIQIVGSYWIVHTLHAKIHPERMMIRDLIDAADGHAEAITETDYKEFKNWCAQHLRQRSI